MDNVILSTFLNDISFKIEKKKIIVLGIRAQSMSMSMKCLLKFANIQLRIYSLEILLQ